MGTFLRFSLILATTWTLGGVSPCFAGEESSKTSDSASSSGFEKPFAAEREALGYDPEGVVYKQNRLEDFQVCFITSAPFSAALNFGLTSLFSKAARGTFKVDGAYSKVFIIGTLTGAAVMATISVSGPKYNPPPTVSLPPSPRLLVHAGPIVTVLKTRF